MEERVIKECNIVPCCSARPETLVLEAVKKMEKEKARQIVVVEKGKPVGLVTLTDVVYRVVAAGKDAKKTKIGDIATKEIFFIDESEPLAKAYMYMFTSNHLFCPIVSGKKFKGLLTLSEAIKQTRRA